MTEVSEVATPLRPTGVGNGRATGDGHATRGNDDDEAIIERARELVETTTLSQVMIGKEVGVSRWIVAKWIRENGWVRPDGAPTQPACLKRDAWRQAVRPPASRADRKPGRLIDRLYRVYAGQVDLIETRLAKATKGLEERDARALATLARTLGTLMALERDDGVKQKTDPDAVDPDEIRAKLARRLYALGQSGE